MVRFASDESDAMRMKLQRLARYQYPLYVINQEGDEPMTLITSKEAWRGTTTTSGGTTPEDQISLVFPSCFAIRELLHDHVDGIPTIRISLRGRVVVMTRDQDIAKSITLCRGENGVEDGNGTPIREEMTLLVSRPRMIAEFELVID